MTFSKAATGYSQTLAASFFGQMRQLLTIAIFGGLLSCSKPADNESSLTTVDTLETPTPITTIQVDTITNEDIDYDSFFNVNSYLAEKSINDSPFEIIDFECAIIINPTDEQIEELKRTEGEENFYIAADDALWYSAQVNDTLDYVGIKTKAVSGRFIRLQGQQQTWDLDVRKKNFPAWNVIIFKTTKDPVIIDMTTLTVDEVKAYFDIRD